MSKPVFFSRSTPHLTSSDLWRQTVIKIFSVLGTVFSFEPTELNSYVGHFLRISTPRKIQTVGVSRILSVPLPLLIIIIRRKERSKRIAYVRYINNRVTVLDNSPLN